MPDERNSKFLRLPDTGDVQGCGVGSGLDQS